MADTFGLSSEPLAPQIWRTPTKELNADFAQSVGTRKARSQGMRMDESILEGIKSRETSTDPFFELRKLEFQSRIAENAAQAADRIRSLKMKEAEIVSEQQDKTELMILSLRHKGDPKAALEAITSFSPRSQLGIRTANEQRLAIIGLMDHDQEAKNLASLSYADRRAYKLALIQSGGQPNPETDAIMDTGLAHVAAQKRSASEFSSTPGKEIGDRLALEKKYGADSPQVKKFDELTAKSSSLSNLGKLLQERKDASPEDQAQYDRVIGHIGEKMGVSMQQDDQGRWIVNYGPQQGTVGTASVATQSMAQRKLLKYEAASELINHLQKNMESGHVGISGVLGEYVGDRIMPQLGVNSFSGKRADVRSVMISARESLLREISDDTRFSNADREEISKALPSSGVFESLPNALQRLDTVRNILNARGRTYSEGLGLKQPEWSLSPDEIKSQYEKHEATGGKEGMSFEKAKSLLERFHHFQP